jgi:hypothetical protein
MPDWAFYTLFLSVIAFWIFNGILMLVAPAKHKRFLYWFGRSRSWSRPIDEQPRRGLEFERRLAGLGIAGMGIYIAWSTIRQIAFGERSQMSDRSVLRPRGDSFSPVIFWSVHGSSATINRRMEQTAPVDSIRDT